MRHIVKIIFELIKVKILFAICWLVPIRRNKIVICSYMGKGFGDNGKYIATKLHEMSNDIDIVWLVNEQCNCDEFPDFIRTVRNDSLKGIYELATARVWVDNCRKQLFEAKRKGQFYIQTWHGGIALKRIERDVADKLSRRYVMASKADSKMADVFVSNSEFCTNMYENKFWYNGKIIECGSPRNDIFFKDNKSINKKVKKILGVKNDCHIALYAPTFRGNVDDSLLKCNINCEQLISTLNNKFGFEWVVLVRLHPNISNLNKNLHYNERIIDATNYSDMYELMYASDILITDYSSSMFEFALSKKPCFLFATDVTEYMNDRNFYFDYYKLPFQVATTNDELTEVINNFNDGTYINKIKTFFSNIGLIENGNASEKISKLILDLCK